MTVAAASSLRNAMPALVQEFAAQGGVRVLVTYGASGDLRKQVEAGAPIDAVIFASAKPVDALEAAGHLRPGTRVVVATNRLVLIGPKDAPALTFESLDRLPPGTRLAIGEPGAVPAGQYAIEVLRTMGKWETLKDRLVYGMDVGAVLAYARRAEVAAAIVYATETRAISEIQVMDEARGPDVPKVEVIAAATSAGYTEGGTAFVEFLKSPTGLGILKSHGFGGP